MYVLKAKPKICTPHSSQTDEPRINKIGKGHPGLDLTPSANFGRLPIGSRGPELWKPEIMSISVCFFFLFSFFSYFFDKATARTAEAILMVDSSNDVFLRKEVPLRGRMIT
jgi:hypothetical protein